MSRPGRPRRSCLDADVPEYVSGRMPEQTARAWDRHIVVCVCCQAAVADERRIQTALHAEVPGVPQDLRTQLLALGSLAPALPVTSTHVTSAPLALMTPTAPPAHRSVRRSAVVAVAAAGASAAAALTLGAVSTTGAPAPTRPSPPTGLVSRGPALPASFFVSDLVRPTLGRPSTSTAQSTP